MNTTALPPTAAASLTLTRPDDWHLHVRDGAAMAAVVPATVTSHSESGEANLRT